MAAAKRSGHPSVGAVLGRFADTLMLRDRRIRLLLVAAATDSWGTALYTALSVLYFTRVLGFTIGSAGAAISVASLVAFFASPHLGRLADRYGPRRALLVMYVVRRIGYALYLLTSQYWSFFVLTCLLIPFDRTSGPIVQALVGRMFGGAERATVLGVVFVVRNGAVVVGSATATLPLLLDRPWLFQLAILGNGVTFLVAALVVAAMPVDDAPNATDPVAPVVVVIKSPVRSPAFVLVTVVNGVLLTSNTLLAVVLPLWVTEHTAAPAWVLTVLLTMNAVIAMSVQIPLNRRFPDAAAGIRACLVAGGPRPVSTGPAWWVVGAVVAVAGLAPLVLRRHPMLQGAG